MKIPAIPIVIVSPYQILVKQGMMKSLGRTTAPPMAAMAAKVCQSAKLCTTHLLLLVELIPESPSPGNRGTPSAGVNSHMVIWLLATAMLVIPRFPGEFTTCAMYQVKPTEGLTWRASKSEGPQKAPSLGPEKKSLYPFLTPEIWWNQKTLRPWRWLLGMGSPKKQRIHPPIRNTKQRSNERPPPALLRTPASELGPLDQH